MLIGIGWGDELTRTLSNSEFWNSCANIVQAKNRTKCSMKISLLITAKAKSQSLDITDESQGKMLVFLQQNFLLTCIKWHIEAKDYSAVFEQE